VTADKGNDPPLLVRSFAGVGAEPFAEGWPRTRRTRGACHAGGRHRRLHRYRAPARSEHWATTLSWEDRKTLGRALPNDEDRLREVSQHYWWWPTSPTTPEADAIMRQNGVLVVPDILANCGGVVVSYFEWVQNLQGYYWEFDEVQEKQTVVLRRAFNDIWNLAQEFDIDMRTASYMMSIRRLEKAMKFRGWY